MSYLYKLYIVVDGNSEDLYHQNIIDEKVEKVFKNQSCIEVVGTEISELDNGNCGKCCKCGSWVSNQELENNISGFSDGCLIDGKWWCDLCVPNNHEKRF